MLGFEEVWVHRFRSLGFEGFRLGGLGFKGGKVKALGFGARRFGRRWGYVKNIRTSRDEVRRTSLQVCLCSCPKP